MSRLSETRGGSLFRALKALGLVCNLSFYWIKFCISGIMGRSMVVLMISCGIVFVNFGLWRHLCWVVIGVGGVVIIVR